MCAQHSSKSRNVMISIRFVYSFQSNFSNYTSDDDVMGRHCDFFRATIIRDSDLGPYLCS